MQKLTLIAAQQRLIDRVNSCHSGHRNRVRRAACRELREWLLNRDFFEADIRQIIRDALDMAELYRNSED